jgi:hypothetical protein
MHNAGEVWHGPAVPWARLIKRSACRRYQRMLLNSYGCDEGRSGRPSFVEARDSILAIDCSSFAAEDEADIWAGFATRGIGFSAKMVIPPDSAKQPYEVTEAFDLPNLSVGQVTLSDTGSACQNGFADPGETVLLVVPLSNPFCKTDARRDSDGRWRRLSVLRYNPRRQHPYEKHELCRAAKRAVRQ